jgi:hypothetical protein
VSVACAERALLPAVRDAAPETLIVTDRFSCRSQMEQLDSGRRAVHLAQTLVLARDYGVGGPSGPSPERTGRRRLGPAVAGAGLAAGGLAAARVAVRRRR